MTANIALPRAKYTTPESRAAFFETLRLRLASLPGVDSVGATSNIPFGGNWSTGSFNVEGFQPPEGQPGPWGDQRLVTPGYHEAMKIKLLRGRFIAPTDRAGAPKVVVIDDEMAKRYWPNVDPIGKRITFADDMSAADVDWITVIGVVEHTAHEGLDAERRVQLYRPVQQRPISQMTFALRSQGDPAHAGHRCPPGGARHRSGPADRPGEDDGGDDGRGVGPAEAVDVPAGHLRRSRAAAVGHRHLRRDVVRRHAPLAGARRADGAWRRAKLGAVAGDETGRRPGAGGRRHRPGGRLRADARARGAAVRRHAHRPGHLRAGRRGPDAGGDDGDAGPGVAGDAARSRRALRCE